MLHLTVNGITHTVADDGSTLLAVLRDQLGLRSVKDGCSPQGQCGCCTVLVDGKPRVACVTPARRVAGREITTLEGLPSVARDGWAGAFCAAGASQCGFCTPGIVLRLHGGDVADDRQIDAALLAHLCRCTGWQTIREAVHIRRGDRAANSGARDLDAAAQRAAIEGRGVQRVAPDVALGAGSFADDSAPLDALVAVPDRRGGYAVGESLAEARAAAGKVQGRRTTAPAGPPLDLPPGEWALTLRTSWVEPAYLELDASWCEPGGEPVSPLANGGAFGGKQASPVGAIARELADRHGRPVRVLWSREDCVRLGPKRPPIAAGVRADGSGVVRALRTPGYAERVRQVAPALAVEDCDVPGPPTSLALRAAGWAEAAVLMAALAGHARGVALPGCGTADAWWQGERLRVRVEGGDPLDEVVLRSYCIGAAHMGYSWVSAEALSVDAAGEVHDLTVRSFGIVRAVDMPPVDVEIAVGGDATPRNVSDSVFAAVAAATWLARGLPPQWPTL